MSNSKLPAFPVTWKDREGDEVVETGLTKREYFAIMAMQGLLAQTPNRVEISVIVKESIDCADELLKQLDL